MSSFYRTYKKLCWNPLAWLAILLAPGHLAMAYAEPCHCLPLTHWGRVTHICVSRLTITGSDNGLSPGRRQAIIWTSAGILLIWPLGTNFSEILIEMNTFSFKKMRLKVSSAKWRPFCLGLNVLTSPNNGIHCMVYYIANDTCPWISNHIQ